MKTLKDGKPGLSLGCRGDRATGGLQNGDVRISMTPEDLVLPATCSRTSSDRPKEEIWTD